MKKIFSVTGLSFLVFMYCSDPSGQTKMEPPEALQMVEKTQESDTTLLELGIDAVPDDDVIQIMWHPYKGLNDVKKFKIYRSSDLDGEKNYNYLDEIDIESRFSQDTTYRDSQVSLETFYYYYVTVVDEDNQESSPSDTVKYRLIDKATLTQPNGQTFSPGDTINFGFLIPSSTNANGFILRIERQVGENFKELVYLLYENPYDDFGQGTIFRSIDTHLFKTLSDLKEYNWRVDIIADNILFEGSESVPASFKINWGN